MTSKDMNKDKDKKQDTPPEKSDGTVEIFTPKYNLLRNKAGARINTNEPGFIDDEKVEAADELINKLCVNSKEKLEEQIGILAKFWKNIQEMPDNTQRTEKTKEIFTIAHEIKDISSLCGYHLIAHFSESLRDYIAETSVNLKNQRIIVQAHIDALSTVIKVGTSDKTDVFAEELKEKVKIAIEKYR